MMTVVGGRFAATELNRSYLAWLAFDLHRQPP
jgi:hypothetical protein